MSSVRLRTFIDRQGIALNELRRPKAATEEQYCGTTTTAHLLKKMERANDKRWTDGSIIYCTNVFFEYDFSGCWLDGSESTSSQYQQGNNSIRGCSSGGDDMAAEEVIVVVSQQQQQQQSSELREAAKYVHRLSVSLAFNNPDKCTNNAQGRQQQIAERAADE